MVNQAKTLETEERTTRLDYETICRLVPHDFFLRLYVARPDALDVAGRTEPRASSACAQHVWCVARASAVINAQAGMQCLLMDRACSLCALAISACLLSSLALREMVSRELLTAGESEVKDVAPHDAVEEDHAAAAFKGLCVVCLERQVRALSSSRACIPCALCAVRCALCAACVPFTPCPGCFCR